MPELPEVETIRRGLLLRVPGRLIRKVVTSDARIFQCDRAEIEEKLPGQSVLSLSRRGKFLIFKLQRELLIFHLGMTGQLTLRDPAAQDSPSFLRHEVTGLQRVRQHPPDHHTHLQVHFDDGTSLLFRDPRKFGKVHLLENSSRALTEFFSGLGLEPLSPEYDMVAFLRALEGRNIRIKTLLLDQKFVAGVGNIYADEALFEARIHPLRTVRSMRRWEKEKLFEAIPRVLQKGIEFGGTSLRDYIQSDGARGNHREELKVYGRHGKPCRRCGSPIEKIYLNQRGTHFCPGCQLRRPQRRSESAGADT